MNEVKLWTVSIILVVLMGPGFVKKTNRNPASAITAGSQWLGVANYKIIDVSHQWVVFFPKPIFFLIVTFLYYLVLK